MVDPQSTTGDQRSQTRPVTRHRSLHTPRRILLPTLILFSCFFFLASSRTFAVDVELTFWNFWDQKLILPAIAAFERQHPGVRIRSEQLSWNNGFDKLVMAIAGGRGPDICELGSTWTGRFMSAGVLLDITDAVKDLQDSFELFEAIRHRGRLYGLPWLVSTRVLAFNRDLFRKAGLDPDRPPTTWQALLDAARRIHDPARGIYGIGINAGEGHVLYKKILPFIWAGGGSIFDENDRWVFDSPPVREALQFFQLLIPYSFREKQDLLDEAFLHHHLGMEITGPWLLARLKKEAPELDLGLALIPAPTTSRGETRSFMGGQVLALTTSCRHPDLAVKFLCFLTQPEYTLPITRATLVSLPAHRGAWSDPFFADARLRVFLDQLRKSVHPPIHPLWLEIEAIINETLERSLFGQNLELVLARATGRFAQAEARFRRRAQAAPVATGPAQSMPPKAVTPTDHEPTTPAVGDTLPAPLLIVGLCLIIGVLSLVRHAAAPNSHRPRALLFLFPWLSGFLLFWLYPVLFSLALSFCDYDILNPSSWLFIGFEHFNRLYDDPAFAQAFTNTLIFGLVATCLLTGIGFCIAFLLHRLQLGRHLLRAAFFLPSLLSVIVVATVFKALYSPLGPLNSMLRECGIQPQSWLTNPTLALPSIIALDVWTATGFSAILFLAALTAVPRQLYEAATLDGADAWTCFRHITLPHLKPMLLFILVMNSIRTWQVFPEVFILTRGSPLGTTDTIVHRLYEIAFRFHDLGYASAMAWTLTMILLLLALAKKRLLQERDP